MDADSEIIGTFFAAALKCVGFAVNAGRVFLVAVFDEDDLAELIESGDGTTASAFPKGLMTLPDSGTEFLSRDGSKVLARGVLVEAPFGRFAVADRNIGHHVAVTLTARVLLRVVKAEQASGQTSNNATEFCVKTGTVAARLLDGLGEFGIRDFRTLALEDEVRGFAFVVGVDNDVGAVAGRAAGDGHLKANSLGAVLILIDEFGPTFGANLLLGVSPALRVVCINVQNALRLAFTRKLDATVLNGAWQVRLYVSVSHGSPPMKRTK